MQAFNIFLLYFIVELLKISQAQVSPIWSTSSVFSTGGGVAQLTDDIGFFTVLFPTGFLISTSPIKQPFFGLSGFDQFVIADQEQFYWLFQLTNITSSSLIIRIQNFVNTNFAGTVITGIYGFMFNKNIKYRYLIVRSSFPNIYLSCSLAITSIPFSINSVSSKVTAYNLLTLSSPSAPALTLYPNTIFFYSLSTIDMNSTLNPLTDSFNLQFKFTPTSGNMFNMTISGKYPLSIIEFEIFVFIFNEVQFSSYFVKLGYQFFNFTGLALGLNSNVQNTYTALFAAANSSFMFGLSGIQVKAYQTFGFQMDIPNPPVLNSFTIIQSNMYAAGAIPNIQLIVILPSQYICPNSQPFIDSTYTSCLLTGCPTYYYASTSTFGLSSTKVCQICNYTCLTCAFSATNCTSCDPLMNRQLTLNKCPPITHYYDNGNVSAVICDANCLQCVTAPTTCTSCNTYAYKTGSTCINCTTFDPNCLTCSSIACTTCAVGYINNVTTCQTCAILFTPNCLTCTLTACTSCIDSYYVSLTNNLCAKCSSTYSSQCLSCNSTDCTNCDLPYFYSSVTKICETCQSLFGFCQLCDTTACLVCDVGYYQDSIGSCSACPSGCLTCASATNCLSCDVLRQLIAGYCPPIKGYFEDGAPLPVACDFSCTQCVTTATTCISCYNYAYLSGSACLNCSTYDANCLSCTNTSCSTCTFGHLNVGTTCQTCQSLFTINCLQCTSSGCNSCSNDSFIDSATLSCKLCTTYSSQCLSCNSTDCSLCASNYFYTTATKMCETCQALYSSSCSSCNTTSCLVCSSGFYVPPSSTNCSTCAGYSPKCSSCNSTQCIICANGFGTDSNNNVCVAIICGDGVWITNNQQCDDGNTDNYDGCDSTCHVQTDYDCNITNMYPNGTSLCKYTKNITVSFSFMQQNPAQNQLQISFTLSPPQMKQWSLSTIQALVSPVQVFDQQTNTSTLIALDNLNYVFNQNQQTNQVQILIDYSSQPLQGKFLFFNVQPNATNITSLDGLYNFQGLSIQMHSGNSGVYLYNYDSIIYQTQATVKALATAVGFAFMILAFAGMCMPAGKLIILEALSVVQISYFSLFQFSKLPPTFVGLKSLLFSNGYNSPSIFSSSQSTLSQNIYSILGIDLNNLIVLSNYNIGFFVLFVIPSIVGLIGYIVSKMLDKPESEMPQNVQTQKQIKCEYQSNSNASNQVKKLTKYKILQIIFQRIMFEVSFYGLLLSGYLLWVCSALSAKSNNSISNYVFIGILISLWTVYSVLFMKITAQSQNFKNLRIQKLKSSNLLVQNEILAKNFGEFTEIYNQITDNLSVPPKYPNLYLILMYKKLLISILIIYLSSVFSFVSVLVLLIYIGLLIAINLFRYRSESTSKRPLISYLNKNYTLRQTVNFSIIILIQLLYIALQAIIQQSDPYQIFAVNQFTTKWLPIIVLVLLLISVFFNTILFLWQIKSSQLLTKLKIVLTLILPNFFFSSLCIQVQNNSSKNLKQQQDEIQSMMDQFLNSSPIFKQRHSPFLGAIERQRKGNLLKLNNIEQSDYNELPIQVQVPKFQQLTKKQIQNIYDEI